MGVIEFGGRRLSSDGISSMAPDSSINREVCDVSDCSPCCCCCRRRMSKVPPTMATALRIAPTTVPATAPAFHPASPVPSISTGGLDGKLVFDAHTLSETGLGTVAFTGSLVGVGFPSMPLALAGTPPLVDIGFGPKVASTRVAMSSHLFGSWGNSIIFQGQNDSVALTFVGSSGQLSPQVSG